jgi:biotin carboxylase
VVQAELPPGTRRAVEDYASRVLAALGVALGPFHCELRLPGGEPVLIELGARMGGDHIPDLVESATGVSLPHLAVAAHTGLDPRELLPGAPRAKHAGIRFLTAPGLASYRAAAGLDQVLALPGVLGAELYLDPGEPIPAEQDFRCRVGHVMYTADSHADALELGETINRGVALV